MAKGTRVPTEQRKMSQQNSRIIVNSFNQVLEQLTRKNNSKKRLDKMNPANDKNIK
jgi:hypothetical protein